MQGAFEISSCGLLGRFHGLNFELLFRYLKTLFVDIIVVETEEDERKDDLFHQALINHFVI